MSIHPRSETEDRLRILPKFKLDEAMNLLELFTGSEITQVTESTKSHPSKDDNSCRLETWNSLHTSKEVQQVRTCPFQAA